MPESEAAREPLQQVSNGEPAVGDSVRQDDDEQQQQSAKPKKRMRTMIQQLTENQNLGEIIFGSKLRERKSRKPDSILSKQKEEKQYFHEKRLSRHGSNGTASGNAAEPHAVAQAANNTHSQSADESEDPSDEDEEEKRKKKNKSKKKKAKSSKSGSNSHHQQGTDAGDSYVIPASTFPRRKLRRCIQLDQRQD